MQRKVNIRIINKQTGRENKYLTYDFMKAVDSYIKITLPEKFIISIQ